MISLAVDLNGTAHRRRPHRCGAYYHGLGAFFSKKGIACSELDAPEADGLACNDDTPLCEQVFDVSVAQAESVAELGSITNDIGWKTETFITVHGAILSIFRV